MSDMWKEFKEFAVKGNAIDLAVGVIIGAAFGGIVTSLVKDILMPPIGLVTGGLDFSNKFVVLKGSATSGDVATEGAIERQDVREEVISHLEGGEESYELKSRKYGLRPK